MQSHKQLSRDTQQLPLEVHNVQTTSPSRCSIYSAKTASVPYTMPLATLSLQILVPRQAWCSKSFSMRDGIRIFFCMFTLVAVASSCSSSKTISEATGDANTCAAEMAPNLTSSKIVSILYFRFLSALRDSSAFDMTSRVGADPIIVTVMFIVAFVVLRVVYLMVPRRTDAIKQSRNHEIFSYHASAESLSSNVPGRQCKWTGQLFGTRDWNCAGKTATLLLMRTLLFNIFGLATFSTCNSVVGYPCDIIVKLGWPDSSTWTNTGISQLTFHSRSWLSNQSSSQYFNAGSNLNNPDWDSFTLTTKQLWFANYQRMFYFGNELESRNITLGGSKSMSRERTPFHNPDRKCFGSVTSIPVQRNSRHAPTSATKFVKNGLTPPTCAFANSVAGPMSLPCYIGRRDCADTHCSNRLGCGPADVSFAITLHASISSTTSTSMGLRAASTLYQSSSLLATTTSCVIPLDMARADRLVGATRKCIDGSFTQSSDGISEAVEKVKPRFSKGFENCASQSNSQIFNLCASVFIFHRNLFSAYCSHCPNSDLS